MERGFLIHLAMTFPTITPYLKGIHLTVDGWRPNRVDEGWKLSNKSWVTLLQHLEETDPEQAAHYRETLAKGKAPNDVSPVPRLRDDIFALSWLVRS